MHNMLVNLFSLFTYLLTMLFIFFIIHIKEIKDLSNAKSFKVIDNLIMYVKLIAFNNILLSLFFIFVHNKNRQYYIDIVLFASVFLYFVQRYATHTLKNHNSHFNSNNVEKYTYAVSFLAMCVLLPYLKNLCHL